MDCNSSLYTLYICERERGTMPGLALLALAPMLAFAPPSTIRAVVSDMDGTLFDFAGRDISPGNVEALTRCIAAGIHVCVATGRIPGPWFAEMQSVLPGLGPCVFGNGALVLDAEGNVIYER